MSDFNDPTPIATPEHFRAALLAVRQKMTPIQLAMLQAHRRSEIHLSAIDRLAELVGHPNKTAARTAYGNFAHLIADELKFMPALAAKKPVWLHALAYGRPDANGKVDGQYEWIMRPELVAALLAKVGVKHSRRATRGITDGQAGHAVSHTRAVREEEGDAVFPKGATGASPEAAPCDRSRTPARSRRICSLPTQHDVPVAIAQKDERYGLIVTI